MNHESFSGTLSRGAFQKHLYELLNLRALKFSPVNKIHLFQCMGKIFCVEFQRYPLKFHAKYLTHTLKDRIFIQHWNFQELLDLRAHMRFWNAPWCLKYVPQVSCTLFGCLLVMVISEGHGPPTKWGRLFSKVVFIYFSKNIDTL